MVTKSDGSQEVLERPSAPEFSDGDGGRFLVIRHKGGVYRLAAHLLDEYKELQAGEPGQARQTPPSW